MSKTAASDERKDLEKALRKSRRSLPINLAFATAGVAVLWSLHHFARLPAWAALGLGLLAFVGAIGDAINVPYVRHRLRRLDAPK